MTKLSGALAAVPDMPKSSTASRTGEGAMLIRRKRGWELPESAATDEAVFRDRRRLLQGLAAGPILAAGFGKAALAADAGLYPAKRDDKYKLDRPITDEKYS